MSGPLRIRIFAHSLVSDWNHGNAHFLRGLARALVRLGHNVRCYEELGSWSLTNLMKYEGEDAIEAVDDFRRIYPELDIHFYQNDETFTPFFDEELRDVDLVLIHEWNQPWLVNRVLEYKERYGFKALFHDTHHRAYTRPADILRFHLHKVDGVLAFGEAIRRIYADGFGVPRVWTFHEAADAEVFVPQPMPRDADVLWIGNWGDEERTRELMEFLVRPAAALPERKVVAYGVRYPDSALKKLEQSKIEYRGYLPNLKAPQAYNTSAVSLHVPRRQYTNGLSGIPTIRVFEALSCGTPLLCSPWSDAEELFHPGEDFLCVPDGEAMRSEIERLLRDNAARRQLGESGRETIRKRHTCRHRAEQLIGIYEEIA
ncbi:MAG TPA: glycosyltransferase [Terriglobales bacterium]|nr:glycosyltransferase [Terriglobales bacterium]